MMTTRWQTVSKIVYFAIYFECEDDLQPFGVHTCMEGCEIHSGHEPYIYTEWGFKSADVPLIRCVREGDKFTYAIAINKNDPEE